MQDRKVHERVKKTNGRYFGGEDDGTGQEATHWDTGVIDRILYHKIMKQIAERGLTRMVGWFTISHRIASHRIASHRIAV